MNRSISLFVASTAVLFVASSVALSAQKPAAKKPPTKASSRAASIGKHAAKETQPPGHDARIEKALASPTEMNFTDSPLTDVVLYLKDMHGIQIQLDGRAMSEAGIDTSTPVTINLKGVSLRSALDLMLRDLNLTWTVTDEVLLITTPEGADGMLTRRVLNVSDLVVCKNSKGDLWDDYDSLIHMIESTVAPTTWHNVGGPGAIVAADFGSAKALVVAQTDPVQMEIADLLAEIRALGKKTPDAGPPRRDRRTTSSAAACARTRPVATGRKK